MNPRYSGKSGGFKSLYKLCKLIRETFSRKEKIQLVKQAISDSPKTIEVFKSVLSTQLDPEVNYGISSLNLQFSPYEDEAKDLKWSFLPYAETSTGSNTRILDWLDWLNLLSNSETFSPSLREKANAILADTPFKERQFLLSILNKNLDLNFDLSMAKEVFGSDFIKLPLDFMKFGDFYKSDTVITSPIIVQPVIDGERFKLVVTPDGVAKAYSIDFCRRDSLFIDFYPDILNLAITSQSTVEVDIILFDENWEKIFHKLFNQKDSEIISSSTIYVEDVVIGNEPLQKRLSNIDTLSICWYDKGFNIKLIPSVQVGLYVDLNELKDVVQKLSLIYTGTRIENKFYLISRKNDISARLQVSSKPSEIESLEKELNDINKSIALIEEEEEKKAKEKEFLEGRKVELERNLRINQDIIRNSLLKVIENSKAKDGLLIKDLSSSYERGESISWMKVRPKELEVYYGTIVEIIRNSKNNSLGFVIKTELGKELFLTTFACRSQQIEVLRLPNLVGRRLEFKMENGSPVFKKFVPTKS